MRSAPGQREVRPLRRGEALALWVGLLVAFSPTLLDLVRQAKYQQALPVCLAALEIDPDNQQVRDALDQARAETAKLAAAEAAGGDAAEEATSKLGEATGGVAEKLGQ